ncbi:MAG TPA: hypothetical protein VJA25_01170 [Dehalococcoidia bacterium]|nr:hypothetical protein [Dehalococcoidia bacterium]
MEYVLGYLICLGIPAATILAAYLSGTLFKHSRYDNDPNAGDMGEP